MELDQAGRNIDELTTNQIYALMEQRGWARIRGGDGTDDDDGDDGDEGDDDDEADSGKTGKSKAKVFTESEVNSLVRTRLAREKKNLTQTLTESIRSQVTKDLETAEAAKKGDLQKVIDDLKPKADAAESMKTRLAVFEELASARFDELIESLPEEIRSLAPDDEADALEKEKWLITKAQPAIEKLRKKGLLAKDDDDDDDDDSDASRQQSTKRRGLNPKDPPRRGKDSKRTVKEIIGEYQGSGAYRKML